MCTYEACVVARSHMGVPCPAWLLPLPLHRLLCLCAHALQLPRAVFKEHSLDSLRGDGNLQHGDDIMALKVRFEPLGSLLLTMRSWIGHFTS